MNLLDALIKEMMEEYYDSIFPTREDVLNHLYCVIGNGYEWIDGKIVDPMPTPRQNMFNVGENYKRTGYYTTYNTWYGLYRHSLFMKLPKDIHPDFYDGAIEVAIKIALSPKPHKMMVNYEHYRESINRSRPIVLTWLKNHKDDVAKVLSL